MAKYGMKEDGLCPECNEEYTSQCRCRIGNKKCNNGHEWHSCQKHHVVAQGSGHNLSPDCCSCKHPIIASNWYRKIKYN